MFDEILVSLNKHHAYFQVLDTNVIIVNVFRSIKITSCDSAGGKFYLAPFRTGVDLEDRPRLLEPFREGNDSASSIEGPRFAAGSGELC